MRKVQAGWKSLGTGAGLDTGSRPWGVCGERILVMTSVSRNV